MDSQETNQDKILSFLSKQNLEAKTVREIQEETQIGKEKQNPLKPVWEALSRLEKDKKVFRFSVDNQDYFTLYARRNKCYAMVKTRQSAHARRINYLLRVTLPSKLARTPSINPLDDGETKRFDSGHYRNRYMENETNEEIKIL